MSKIKIFSNYNFLDYGCIYCPCCGERIDEYSRVDYVKSMLTPLGKLEEYLMTCQGCSQEFDYLLSLKP